MNLPAFGQLSCNNGIASEVSKTTSGEACSWDSGMKLGAEVRKSGSRNEEAGMVMERAGKHTVHGTVPERSVMDLFGVSAPSHHPIDGRVDLALSLRVM